MSKETETYVQELYKALYYSSEQFDKNVLLIASGALGISFAFIENLVDLNKAISKNILIHSWYWFAGVIFISLVSHFVSSLSIRWTVENINSNSLENGRKRWNIGIRILNAIMIIGLLVGTVLLINFIQQNLNHE